MSIDRRDLTRLLDLVDRTIDREIDCGQFLHRASGYIERISTSDDRPAGWDDVVQHLSVCSECAEELEVLRGLLAEDS
ncbi:MAG: hypothetical protein KDB53_14480 [Planctomycetes bacterium]|nr:hypothetical protein [Planctomycetota bacterium]